ncbi:hypothetical protein DPMN_045360 [Dreissena polymorpha]|uniref:Uncharacterized protein n=1 Tax=Dreissena polymorpha TaxID=45954 RepID=A0A9D4D5V6_DREPO|nr:hypothetical protein DPMN_045360 [Dreissena polymorpha]
METGVWLKNVAVEVAAVLFSPVQVWGTLGKEVPRSVCYNTGLELSGLCVDAIGNSFVNGDTLLLNPLRLGLIHLLPHLHFCLLVICHTHLAGVLTLQLSSLVKEAYDLGGHQRFNLPSLFPNKFVG